MRNEQQPPRWAVIDIFCHLRGDLPGQIGADAGNERRRNDGARLHHIGRWRRGDSIRRHGAAIYGGVDESKLAILRGWRRRLRRKAERAKVGDGFRHDNGKRGRSRCTRPCLGAGEQPADASSVEFLKPVLFPGADAGNGLWPGQGNRLATFLAVEDRPPEIARQRRTQLRHAGIIPRQPLQAVRRGAVLGAEQLGGSGVIPAPLQGENQRAANPGAGDDAQTGQYHARQTGDARGLGPQPHIGTCIFRSGFVCVVGCAACQRPFIRRLIIVHDAGLPSVRTMRMRCWL